MRATIVALFHSEVAMGRLVIVLFVVLFSYSSLAKTEVLCQSREFSENKLNIVLEGDFVQYIEVTTKEVEGRRYDIQYLNTIEDSDIFRVLGRSGFFEIKYSVTQGRGGRAFLAQEVFICPRF